MAITSYSTLRTAVAGSAGESWSHRGDVISSFDTFLALAEEEIYSGPPDGEGLRTRELETRSTASLSTSSRFLALPDNFIEARKARLEYSSVRFPLKFVTPAGLYENVLDTGRPCRVTVTSQYEFDITPDVAYTMEVQHYAKQTAISSSNTTNTVLTAYPSIYLHGVLSHLFQWALNDQRADLHRNLFIKAIEKANREDRWGRLGPQPTMEFMGEIV